jgi:hypothetical protein
LSILYDDGKTRWLARGNYRRESFPDNQQMSGDYYAISGEFSRELNDRHAFSILGGYSVSSSLVAGEALTEPGQLQVIVPTRGNSTTGTSWSPSISSFWSRRFSTTLTYEANQSFAGQGGNVFNRYIALSGGYMPSLDGAQAVIRPTNRNMAFLRYALDATRSRPLRLRRR